MFCDNVVELAEKQKILEDGAFERWIQENENYITELYVEKKLINELQNKELILIDAIIWKTMDGEQGLLFIRKDLTQLL